ncbi:MAG: outer membrane PBP1 activator LpoA protein [Oleiphilaceae bacterium]|jgi:outer membrane PBP1 activator LpoA protein
MKAFILIPILIFSLLILGCSTPSPTKSARTPNLSSNNLSPETLISKARLTQDPSQKSSLHLQAALIYWESNLTAQANGVLLTIDPGSLNHDQLQKYLLLTLKIGLLEDNSQRLAEALPLFSNQIFYRSSIDQQLELTLLISKAYQATDKPIQAAITLIENAGLFEEDIYLKNHEIIWSELRKTELPLLSQYKYFGENIDVEGWLTLAQTIKQNQIDLDTQYLALNQWNKTWPDHPAAIRPPHELEILIQLPTTQPTEIILALPLTGPISLAGKAIQDGFMASYYSNPSKLGNDIEIVFFDTNLNNIEDLYNQDKKESALIIGPLDKNSLNKLTTLEQLNIKTLALNYLDDNKINIPNLYQFGLAPETETKQIANRLSKKGFTKIGVIAPETNWGFRLHDSFVNDLILEGNTPIESVFYSDQASLSQTVAKLLATDESKKRAQKIRAITNTRFEFQPRRRKDIDAILMIARPNIAKQINPLFAYHYANSIPVFSTSQVHSGSNDNNDLEGIEFIEMPWMLSSSIDIKQQINNIIPESSQKYMRFYAFGVDAFKLAPRLTLLKEVNNSKINGHTGILSMNDMGHINRDMEWAKFRRGKTISIKE